jgi:phospho-N-acetylmuramoyl-pentapeptide-transferase
MWRDAVDIMLAFLRADAPAVIGGALAAAVVIPLLIRRQRSSQLGQQVYEDAPRSHAAKQGTPTLGGLALAAAIPVALLIEPLIISATHRGALALPAQSIGLALFVLAVAAIGFIDDVLILFRRRALGLRARWKFGLILVVAAVYVAWVHQTPLLDTSSVWWFTGSVHLAPWLWTALAVLAILGATNAVNLTDGLDGLAAGTTIPLILVFAAVFASPINGGMIAAAVLGALLVFYWYNRHPAQIFMGDTGSLLLGALIAGLAIQTGLLLLLPIFGVVFVIEALSVIAQVISFKSTGKRIFKMSPLHHHFELSGFEERRITGAFSFASWIAAVGSTIGLYLTTGLGLK